MSPVDTESILLEESRQHGLQEYFNGSNELEQEQPNEHPFGSHYHSPIPNVLNESCENYPDYEKNKWLKMKTSP